MRRVVQKAVENTVARQMLAREVQAGGVIEITLQQVTEMLEKKKQATKILENPAK